MQIELAILSLMHGVHCIGPISRGYEREELLREMEEECHYLRKMNIRGKLAIHPSQVRIINRIFDISSEQIEQARSLLSTFMAAKAQGTFVIVHDNEMQDKPSLKGAIRFLQYAEEHGYVAQDASISDAIQEQVRQYNG
jgi:citrate lyase beta subunit